MNVNMEWRGSSNIRDESGMAKFTVNGSVLELKLPNFKFAMQMESFLKNAYRLGSFNATANTCDKIRQVLDELEARAKP